MIYAVSCGRNTGLFYTWDACMMAIKDYPGATYISSENLVTAERYLRSRLTHQVAVVPNSILTPDNVRIMGI